MEERTAIHLRSARAEDLSALRTLDQVCYPPGIAYSMREMRYFLSRRGAVSVIAEDEEGRLAGFAIAEPARIGRIRGGHVTTIDVAPEARRRGVGTLLMNAIEGELTARGLPLIRLEVAVDNHGAQRFYAGRGYEAKGTIRGYYLGKLDALVMEKTLHTEMMLS